jgi:hypothetical protein
MAGTKTWADGDALTAADLNGFVRDQWITICTSGTRPSTSQTGRHIYETDTRRMLMWDGAAWIVVREQDWATFTPTWTASTTNPTLGNGTLQGWWRYATPKTIDIDYALTIGSTTALGSGVWRLSTPSSLVGPGWLQVCGSWLTGTGPSSGVAFSGSNAWVEMSGGVSGNYVQSNYPHNWLASQILYVSVRGLNVN